jgi:DNA-directed RNA polymerase subunit RPC12/RpoP
MSLIRCAECSKKISDKATACPHCGAPIEISVKKRGRASSGFGCLALLIVVGVIVVWFAIEIDKDSKKPSSSRSSEAIQTKPRSSLPKYEVVDRDTHESPIKSQIEVHAVVSGKITEGGIREMLNKLYAEAQTARGFKYNRGRPSHILVYVYTSQEHFESGRGQHIAMLSKMGNDARADITVKSDVIKQLGMKPEVKYGLSESERRAIFKLIGKAEDRANAEAQRLYPVPDLLSPGYSQTQAETQSLKQMEKGDRLREKYTEEIAHRYGITVEELQQIGFEGLRKNWPWR